jgi:hypothetical protein
MLKIRPNHLQTIAIIISVLFIAYIYSSHLIISYFNFESFAFESGEFYTDKLLSFSIAKAAKDYGINFYDPYNRSDIVFYQFFFYWILGAIAKLFNQNPWYIANIIQIFLAPAMFVVIYLLAVEITENKVISLISAWLLFLFGSLEYYITGNFESSVFGAHAIIFPFSRQMYGFYIDNYALLLGYIGFIFLLRFLKNDKKIYAVLFILFSSIAFLVHLLPAIFFIVLYFLTLYAYNINVKKVKKINVLVFISSIILFVLMLYISKFNPSFLLLGLFGIIFFVQIVYTSFDPRKYIVPFFSMIPVFIYIIINIVVIKNQNPEKALYFDEVRKSNLVVPLDMIIFSFLPYVVIIILLFFLFKKLKNKFLFNAIVTSVIIVLYNNYLGYNNHPYRFIPYIMPLVTILSVYGLYMLLNRKEIEMKLIFSTLTILISMGIFANFGTMKIYQFTTSKQINPTVRNVARKINTLKINNNNLVFAVDNNFLSTENLAPYTSAKFLYSSPIAYDKSLNESLSQLSNSTTINSFLIHSHIKSVKPDYFISNKILEGDIPINYFIRKFNNYYVYDLKWLYSKYNVKEVPFNKLLDNSIQNKILSEKIIVNNHDIYMHPADNDKASIEFLDMTINENTYLHFGIELKNYRNGVQYSIFVDNNEIYKKEMKKIGSEYNILIPLTRHIGNQRVIRFQIDPLGDNVNDWSYWLKPELLTIHKK